jgi:hypothetical protein
LFFASLFLLFFQGYQGGSIPINGIDSTNLFLIDWTWHIDLIPRAATTQAAPKIKKLIQSKIEKDTDNIIFRFW